MVIMFQVPFGSSRCQFTATAVCMQTRTHYPESESTAVYMQTRTHYPESESTAVYMQTRTHYPESESIGLCSYSLVMSDQRRNRKCTFYNFATRVTRRGSLVEQELLTLPEHLSSPSVFIGVGSCCSICSFLCSVLQIAVCPFSFGH